MTAVLCIDFDETVVQNDIMVDLAERFARSSWKQLQAEREKGERSAEEYSAALIDLIDASEEQVREHALEVAALRPGLLELLDWAHWNEWSVAILSTGWDVYVNGILDREGIDRAVRHCGRARFGYRWRVRFLSPRGIELVDGFKLSYTAAYRDQGDFVAYAGSGAADVEPARVAHAIFARGKLPDEVRDVHQRIHSFETFHDVTAILQQEADAWLESFSSTTAAEA